MAAELVRHHSVLPVLDGLDEMDPTPPDGMPSAGAARALAALRALNAYQESRSPGPLILTCRTIHHDALASRTRTPDAARNDIDPVPASRAGADLVLHQLWPLAGHRRVRVADALLTAFAGPLPPLLLTLLLFAVLPKEIGAVPPG
ncbi:hypothetical protein [Streptomyces sp. NPDC017086]|uniref:hypothetical protein n=1 Tax=Streptomyces sp. NPDC017086 TaxID=3364976 RepID=UPI00379CCB71